MRDPIVRKLIIDTLRVVEDLVGVEGRVDEVIIPRLHPWAASYVSFEDGFEGCGFSSTVYKGTFRLPKVRIPYIFNIIREIENAYEAVEKLANMKFKRLDDQTLANGVAVSMLNALSYRLLEPETLRSKGYRVNESKTGKLLFGHRIGSFLRRFLTREDRVTVVGFAYWIFPYIASFVKEIRCLELVDEELYEVYTLSGLKPRVKVSRDLEEPLGEADVALITGMSIPNETLPDLMKLSRDARLRIAYGPSCSFYPERLFDMGFDVLFAMKTPADYETRIEILDGRGLHPYEDPFTRLLVIERT